MAVSQFTIYRSNDVGAPVLTGAVGSLITVLDACLVNGYGSKAAAGWTKPIANAGNIGIYKQGTGSAGCTLLINDNAPNATAGAREAWAVGWETVATIASLVGTGTGQFPTPAQLLTTGHVVIRKSSSADTVARTWVLFADSRTMYFFSYPIHEVAYPDFKYNFCFGDYYAFSPTDTLRCMIIGRHSENTGSAQYSPGGLTQSMMSATNNYGPAAKAGHYIPRSYSGSGTSTPFYTTAGGFSSLSSSGGYYWNHGTMPAPNPLDGKVWICPITVWQPIGVPYDASGVARGRLRGVWAWLHTKTSLPDQLVFEGAGEHVGKSFIGLNQVEGQYGGDSSAYNGCCLIETSNTVETN